MGIGDRGRVVGMKVGSRDRRRVVGMERGWWRLKTSGRNERIVGMKRGQ